MATPIIQSVGSSSGAGIAGQGRNDLVPGETVTLSDESIDNVGATFFWEFLDYPLGTAPTLLNPTTATPSFVVDADPDLAGSYHVRCTVDGADLASEIFAVPLVATGARIPAFQEQLEYDGGGNAKGWHEAMTAFLRTADKRLPQPNEQTILRFDVSGRETHNSDTPLVCGAISFSPDTYDTENASLQVQFVVHAANGTTPLTTHVLLYNITDDEIVSSSVINIVDTTEVAKYSPTLAIGLAAGELKTGAERIYECRIYLDDPPVDPSVETIELFKAELKVIQTF